ncbi:DNA polymerase delta subunit 3 [Morella rubra]|uniref:DNA polymerase delta subunit 3 n=1 Tax=Morella rubra TaxID=262757 RepID=A0A6A1VU23_9ROSI|nr:DNA polymerase delta subunit 3 [Morella rubra]
MAGIETLGILEEIQSLVSDKLQVPTLSVAILHGELVSYKWLSRNYLVSSNAAKRLLQEFVEKHGSGLEVVYTLSGWLKSGPPNYHIRLVSGPKLAEAEQEFDGSCSVQVYSVQTSIPKDPAALWNAEYVQAEELFKQHTTVDNCLRDNSLGSYFKLGGYHSYEPLGRQQSFFRFCGISNSFVKRSVEGTPVSISNQLPKTAGSPGHLSSVYQNTKVPQSQQTKVQQPSQKDVKSEYNGTGIHGHNAKPPADKEKVLPVPLGKKSVQNGKNPSGAEGSLANFWGRASAKSKDCVPAGNNNIIPNATGWYPFRFIACFSAEADICAREAVEVCSSDDDGRDVNFKRASSGEGGRKRRVVFYFSDEDEEENKDAVNLASPKSKSSLDQKQSTKIPALEKSNMNFDEEIEDKPKVKEGIADSKESNQPLREESSVTGKSTKTVSSSDEKVQSCIPEIDVNKKDTPTVAAPSSPKRRKVLKTRIDVRGREVTEVIWEGKETEVKKADSSTTTKTENSALANTVNRPPAAKKSPATGNTAPSNPTGKAGSKKAGNLKDPKQGNILSFFKRV